MNKKIDWDSNIPESAEKLRQTFLDLGLRVYVGPETDKEINHDASTARISIQMPQLQCKNININ